jgi:hypothetical protein
MGCKFLSSLPLPSTWLKEREESGENPRTLLYKKYFGVLIQKGAR